MKEDTRSPNTTIHDLLIKAGIPIETVSLSCGDYSWNDLENKSIGIERKTWLDLLASFSDGRLGGTGIMKDGVSPKDELQRMVDAYDHTVLLIEGQHFVESSKIVVGSDDGKWIAIRNNRGIRQTTYWRSQWYAAKIYRSLWEYTRYLGVEIIYTGNAHGSGVCLVEGWKADQLATHGDKRQSRRWVVPPKPKWYDFIHLPGVGAKRWEALDKSAKSVYDVGKLNEKELQKLVGNVSGTKIYKWIMGTK